MQTDSVFRWIMKRERGSTGSFIHTRSVKYNLWRHLQGKQISDDSVGKHKGGVFGLKYCPNGQVLVAACEEKCLVLVDPQSNKVVKYKQNAHCDCVNNILFIDERMFASCSDDKTIAVWDLRNMKKDVFLLKGHTAWVKNVELHQPTKQLVSSAFDDTIRVWDINNNLHNDVESRVLLNVAGLLRIRLSPAGDNLYLSSSKFREVIGINNLDLMTLEEDIGFIKSENDFLGLTTRRMTIPPFNHLNQTKPIFSRNQIDRYRGWGSPVLDMYGDDIVGHSIDIHPNNSAVLVHCIGAFDKVTVVHNTKRFYGFNVDENCTNTTEQLPLIRGSPTHLLPFEFASACEYLEEVSFAPCGRLVASPFGYGVTIAAFDEDFNDYETHMAQTIHSAHVNTEEKKTIHGVKGSKRARTIVESGYLKLEPRLFTRVKTFFGHKSSVLSTAFSPVGMQVASGAIDGSIIFYNPIL